MLNRNILERLPGHIASTEETAKRASALVFECGAGKERYIKLPSASFYKREILRMCSLIGEKFESGKYIIKNSYVLRNAFLKYERARGEFSTESYQKGKYTGTERLRIIAEELVISGRGRLSEENLHCFLYEYSKSKALNAKELYFLPEYIYYSLFRLMYELLRKLYAAEKKGEESESGEKEEKLRSLMDIEIKKLAENVFCSFRFTGKIERSELAARYSKSGKILSRNSSFISLADDSKEVYILELAETSRKYRIKESALVQKICELSQGGDIWAYLLGEKRRELLKQFGKNEYRFESREAYVFFFYILPAFLSIALFRSILAIPAFVVLHVLIPHLYKGFIRSKRVLPRLKEIPEGTNSLVVISALLSGNEEVLIRKLKSRALANRERSIRYALLLDYPEGEEEDSEVAEKLIERIRREDGGECRLCIFIRKKRYGKDGIKRGWERKRGAILELCALLLGKETRSEFRHSALPENISHIIVLDEDTEPMPGSLKKLVCAAVHPYNRAAFSGNGRLTGGRSIIAPGIGLELESAERNCFTRLFCRNAGTDRYSEFATDFFFGELGKADFCGKGIIDIKAFYSVFDGLLPENLVLSHDHIEGAYLNCGSLPSVRMYEGFPDDFISYELRRHRWIRGDMQALPFLFKSFKNEKGEWIVNRLTGMDRLRLFGNIVSNLFDAALWAILTYAVVFGDISAYILFIAGIALPELTRAFSYLRHGETAEAAYAFMRMGFSFIILPLSSYISLDAAGRSLHRLLISKKKLLEWTTAAMSQKKRSIAAYLRMYWLPVISIISLVVYGAVFKNIAALVLGIIYLFSPLAAYLIGAEKKKIKRAKSGEKLLLAYAYKMWRFFAENMRENGFVPDNIQIRPKRPDAERLSPTNAAYALAAPIIACDLGFITPAYMLRTLEKQIGTLEELPKWRGHLYNWYSLSGSKVLEPSFVSTVDSGNLACYLAALSQSIVRCVEEFSASKLQTAAIAMGIKNRDVLELVYDIAESSGRRKREKLLELVQLCNENVLSEFGESAELYLAEDADGDRETAEALSFRLKKLYKAIDFAPLFDKKKKLFSIGFDIASGELSASYYDLFASEAKQAYFAAICKGDIPAEAWFSCDRSLVRTKHGRALASWSGTMFEYMMPAILFPSCRNSLSGESEKAAVTEQLSLSPGISESAYYELDKSLNYQYKAFGVSALAYRADPENEKVYSPYSAFLALETCPEEALRSLKYYSKNGMEGKYGLYEALDARKSVKHPVASYMVHHMGMSLCSIYNYISGGKLRSDFMNNAEQCAHSLLLKEKRAPMGLTIEALDRQAQGEASGKDERAASVLLSNGEVCIAADRDGIKRSFIMGRLISRKEQKMRAYIDGKETELYLEKAELRSGSAKYYYKIGEAVIERELCICPNVNALVVKLKTCGGDAQINCELVPSLDFSENIFSHLAMSELFIEAKLGENYAFARRRPRDGEGDMLYMGLFCFGSTQAFFGIDRRESGERFYNSVESAPGMPMLACGVKLREGEECHIVMPLAKSEEELIKIAEAIDLENVFSDAEAFSDFFEGDAGEKKAAFYDEIAAVLLNNNRVYDIGRDNQLPLSCLYQFGVSGKKPLLLGIGENDEFFGTMLEITAYLRRKAFPFEALYINRKEGTHSEQTDGLYCISRDEIENSVLNTLYSAASLVLDGKKMLMPQLRQRRFAYDESRKSFCCRSPELPELMFYNGFGGFSKNGEEYVMRCSRKRPLPGPYAHIITDGKMGTALTAAGWSYIWFCNSRLYRITPHEADRTEERATEFFCITDEKMNYSMHPLPNEFSDDEYMITFGKGFAMFESCGEIETRARIEVRNGEKLTRVGIKNNGTKRKLALHYLAKLQLGESFDLPKGGIGFRFFENKLFALNPLSDAEKKVYVYAETAGERRILEPKSYSSDGFEVFDGDKPVYRKEYSGNLCSTAKPVFALKVEIEIDEGEEKEVRIVLGCIDSSGKESQLPLEIKPQNIEIRTPEPSLDFLVNHWLPYQTRASRLLGKTAYYQSGGAWGFRDQLQDAISLLHCDPEYVRRLIIYFAGKQFVEGDVLHWWHEVNLGIRTNISDDLLFLPFAVLKYIEHTEDYGILDEEADYLVSEEIENGKDLYREFESSGKKESILLHMLRAIDRASALGIHGLPLMKGGDWNDSMDRVGEKGRGESVFLAFFISYIKEKLMPILLRKGMKAKAAQYEEELLLLKSSIDESAWDGEWYIRAFYDDGTALGSASDNQIDLLSQAWAVLSGAADKEKGKKAIKSAYERLFKKDEGIFLLIDPPFDRSEHNPGYIKGYIPGVRENGAQYTHAAAWGIIALLRAGMKREALEILRGLNPIERTKTRRAAISYAAEPYALAADIYNAEGARGMSGWTWYTGSAAVLYTLVIEDVIGIRKRGRELSLMPNVPENWESFELRYIYGSTEYHIKAERGAQIKKIELEDDGKIHEVVLGY